MWCKRSWIACWGISTKRDLYMQSLMPLITTGEGCVYRGEGGREGNAKRNVLLKPGYISTNLCFPCRCCCSAQCPLFAVDDDVVWPGWQWTPGTIPAFCAPVFPAPKSPTMPLNPDSDAALTSKPNQRRMPWCNRKMSQKYRNGSEELRSKNAVCAAGVYSKGMLMCRNRMRREANKGRLNILLKK